MSEIVFDTSIAVLPFVNLRGQKDDEYLGDGISNEIINLLSRNTDLKVTARTSSFSFKNQSIDIPTIGEKLGVSKILEGTITRNKDRVRVNVQLINAADGFQLWSEKYDRDFIDLFDLQDELAESIAQQLKLRLDTKKVKSPHSSTNLEAYSWYLKGQYFAQKWIPGNLEKSLNCYEKSILLDGDFAPSYSGLASCWSFIALAPGGEAKTAYQRAREYTLKALKLDVNSSEAHMSLALLKLLNDLDFSGAFHSFERAMKLDEGNAQLHHLYSFYLNCIGKNKEAVKEMEWAVELDPLSSQVSSTYGYTLMVAGEYEKALIQLEKTLDLDPDSNTALDTKAWILVYLSRFDEAESIFKQINSHILAPASLCFLFHQKGDNKSFNYYLKKLEDCIGENSPVHRELAMVYALIGEYKRAIYHTELALEENLSFITLLSHPAWRNLRNDTSFYKLRKKLRLANASVITYQNLNSHELVVIKTDTKEELVVSINELIYIEAQANYSKIVWYDGDKINEKLLRVSLNSIEDQIISPDLYRCHRSFIINTRSQYHLAESTRDFKLTPVHTNIHIPVSRSKVKEVSALFIS